MDIVMRGHKIPNTIGQLLVVAAMEKIHTQAEVVKYIDTLGKDGLFCNNVSIIRRQADE